MTIRQIVTAGYGAGASIGAVVLRGYFPEAAAGGLRNYASTRRRERQPKRVNTRERLAESLSALRLADQAEAKASALPQKRQRREAAAATASIRASVRALDEVSASEEARIAAAAAALLRDAIEAEAAASFLAGLEEARARLKEMLRLDAAALASMLRLEEEADEDDAIALLLVA